MSDEPLNKPAVQSRQHSLCRLEKSYALWDRVVQGQASGGWALDEAVVFGRYDLFAKRCRKLISLFTTIHQFSLLAQVIQPYILLSITFAPSHFTPYAYVCRQLAMAAHKALHLVAQHTHIEGLEALMRGFGDIIEDIRRKPYDLLDATKTTFDRDFLEFNVHIHDLELAIHVMPMSKSKCMQCLLTQR